MKCLNCNSEIEKYGKKFCNQECYHTFRKNFYNKKYTKPCIICGKEFRHNSMRPDQKTCSRECLIIVLKHKKRSEATKMQTSKTLKKFWKDKVRKGTPHTEEQKIKIKNTLKLKGINKGSKNGNWRNGASRNLFRGDNWKEIKNQVYKRDKWTCQRCGKIKCRVYAHHKIPWRNNMNNNLNNLITLCRSCHTIVDNEIIRNEKQGAQNKC